MLVVLLMMMAMAMRGDDGDYDDAHGDVDDDDVACDARLVSLFSMMMIVTMT